MLVKDGFSVVRLFWLFGFSSISHLASSICFLLCLGSGISQAQEHGKNRPLILNKFQEMENLTGSYSSGVLKDDGTIQVWNNDHFETLDGGITVFTGQDWHHFDKGKVVAQHRIIDDLFDKQGELHPKRFFTRPSVVYSKKDKKYYSVTHVAKGYPPQDGRVFPAFLSSATGKEGTWKYHGMFKGEIMDKFGAGKKAVWASGLGLVLNDNASSIVDHKFPVENRFIFYTDGYTKGPGMVLLYSATGKEWFFVKDNSGNIRNLKPDKLKGVGLIFPSVVRTPEGFHGYSTQGWPPKGIWRLFSKDGLEWQVWNNSNTPEIPANSYYKNMSLFYDPQSKLLHGMLSVFENGRFQKYHSVLDTR
jgi:hypothetical protein